MELADLHTFFVVAEEQSFARAARRLHRTPPAVSLAVKRLERRVGTALFSRETKPAELTPAGRLLAGYAGEIGRVQDEARGALARLRQRPGLP
ncbi:MAG: LysR family transcriptional regulator [Vicinamibacterales bacterium]